MPDEGLRAAPVGAQPTRAAQRAPREGKTKAGVPCAANSRAAKDRGRPSHQTATFGTNRCLCTARGWRKRLRRGVVRLCRPPQHCSSRIGSAAPVAQAVGCRGCRHRVGTEGHLDRGQHSRLGIQRCPRLRDLPIAWLLFYITIFYVFGVRRSFHAKRALLLGEWPTTVIETPPAVNVYVDELRLFSALHRRKRPEPRFVGVCDIALVLLVGVFVAGLPSLGGFHYSTGYSLGLSAAYLAFVIFVIVLLSREDEWSLKNWR
jgi:hypothetical protein